jgi:hypothetical protein
MAATVDEVRRMLEVSAPGFLQRYNAPEAHGFYAIHAPPIDFADVSSLPSEAEWGERRHDSDRQRREEEKSALVFTFLSSPLTRKLCSRADVSSSPLRNKEGETADSDRRTVTDREEKRREASSPLSVLPR